jgi:hypothetical protein
VASFAALGQREVAIVDLAMFDAVNSIARHYQPYLRQVPILEPTSMDASAASEDGAVDVDPYRPKTRPGQYVPTATMVGSTWPIMRPLVLASPSQFRPGPLARVAEPGMGDGLQ